MKKEIKKIHNEPENKNKAPTMNNIREKLGLDKIENNNKDETKEELMKNAPYEENGFFRVPKIN